MAHTALPVIVVVLGIDSRSTPDVLRRATDILAGIEGNPSVFKTPNPPTPQMKTHISGLDTAQSAFKNHTTSRSPRDDAQKIVIADMKIAHAYVQQLVTANPAQAEAIATAACMTLRRRNYANAFTGRTVPPT